MDGTTLRARDVSALAKMVGQPTGTLLTLKRLDELSALLRQLEELSGLATPETEEPTLWEYMVMELLTQFTSDLQMELEKRSETLRSSFAT